VQRPGQLNYLVGPEVKSFNVDAKKALNSRLVGLPECDLESC
jgi:hypothetical protein